MSRGWERFFFLFTWLTQGSSYLSPRAYGIMHRLHHAHTDTEEDPHSPAFDKNALAMMDRTRRFYSGIFNRTIPVEARYEKNVPDWGWFDRFANGGISRILWIALYVWIYIVFAPSLWWFILLPIHAAMGPVHGVIINWFAHKYGNVNFETDNTSKNLFRFDWLMMGEGYHNNHHKYPSRVNFASEKGEFDPSYPMIKLLQKMRVIKLAKNIEE